MRIINSQENYKQYKTVDFYILKRGELFYFKNKKYRKINNDFAMNLRTKTKTVFWPQINVRMIKSMNLEKMLDKYPTLQYTY